MANIDNVVSEFENQIIQIIRENPNNVMDILRNTMLNIQIINQRDYPNVPNMLTLVLNNPNGQVHPLEYACIFGGSSIPIAQLLLEFGSNINSHGNLDGNTPLHNAVLSGNADLVNFLLVRGANVNEMDNNQQTPLQRAETLQAQPNNNVDRNPIIQLLRNFNGNQQQVAQVNGGRRKRTYKRKRSYKRKNSYKRRRRTNRK
jgi:ankyrin repeat protein